MNQLSNTLQSCHLPSLSAVAKGVLSKILQAFTFTLRLLVLLLLNAVQKFAKRI